MDPLNRFIWLATEFWLILLCAAFLVVAILVLLA